MSAILNTFTGKNITPKNEAVIYDTAIGESGVFNGCALASLGSNQVSIAAGDGIIKGRKFTIEAETIACALATAGTMPGRIYLKMDLSNATTPLEIKTVVASTLPALVKDEDCNFTNGIYEVAIGTYTASTTAVSNLVPVFNQINLHAILKTKAEVTANTKPGRLADALVVKELITNLNDSMKTIATLFNGTITATNTIYTLSNPITNYKYILIRFRLGTGTEGSCMYPSSLLKNDTVSHRVIADAGNMSSFYYETDTSLHLWGTMTTATVFGIS